MTRKIGIFGGSFSPPHAGHISAARAFQRAIRPDVLYVIPAYISPGKTPDGGATPDDRLEMCRLAFADIPDTVISDMELTRGGKSYTADTLRALSSPDTELYVLCGTDTALSLDTWHEPGVLFSLARFVCIRREHDEDFSARFSEKNAEYAARFGATVTLIDAPLREVASRDLRSALRLGGDPPEISPAVLEYIRQKGLYT